MAEFFIRDDGYDVAVDPGIVLFLILQIPDPYHWFTGFCLPERKDRGQP
jgi:hypothetical protein